MAGRHLKFADRILFVCFALFSAICVGMLFAPRSPQGALLGVIIGIPSTFMYGYSIRLGLRQQRFVALLVSTPPGGTLRMSVGRVLIWTLGFAIPGIAMPLLAPADWGWGRYAFAVVFLAMAGLLLWAIRSDRVSRTYLRFDVTGLTVNQRDFEFLVPWDNIAHVAEFEFARTECVGMKVGNTAGVLVKPESNRDRLNKMLSNNLALYGHQLVFMALHYSVDAGSLAAALRRYATNAGARQELTPKPALPSPA